jgi:selenocysteine-specific elongation factor
VLERLEVLEQGSPAEIIMQQLQTREPADLRGLQARVAFSVDETRTLVEALVQSGDLLALDRESGRILPTTQLISRTGWERLAEQAQRSLRHYHEAYPLRSGMPREELRTRLGLDSRVFNRVQEQLLDQGLIAESGPLVRSIDHVVVLNEAQERSVRAMLQELASAGASPPPRNSLEEGFELSSEVIDALVTRGDLVDVAPDLVYDSTTYTRVVEAVVGAIQTHGSLSVAQVRDTLGTSRRYALALMAHLDERKVTRRVGDERVLM